VMINFDAAVKLEQIDVSKAYTNLYAMQSKLQFDA
jgi:hypothetical protein